MTLPSSSSQLATLIAQFQAQHPKGSLITELLMIHEGSYVVRALVQIGGMTVTTGMATATEIEQAEDRARIRALEAFGLSQAAPVSRATSQVSHPVSQIPLVPPLDSPPIEHSPTPPPLPNGSALPTPPSPPSRADATPFQEPLEAIAPPLPAPTPHSTAWETPTADPADSLLPPLPSPPAELQPDWDTPDLLSNDFAATAPPPLTNEPLDSYQVPYQTEYQNDYQTEYQTEYQDDYQEPEETPLFNLPVDEPPAKATRPKKTTQRGTTPPAMTPPAPDTPYDRSEELAEILVQMKRLDWSKEQGRIHLQQTYGKRSRQELDDNELLDFLKFLQAQPSPTNSLL